ncbi:MAG: DNA polymerase III subunit delta [Chloroflexota bacterium]
MIGSLDALLALPNLPSVILLFGEEDFLIEEAYQKIIKKLNLGEEDMFDFDTLDAESINPSHIADVCASLPMMSERRIVSIPHLERAFPTRVGKKIEERSAFGDYLERPSESTILILRAQVEQLNKISQEIKKGGSKKLDALRFPWNKLVKLHYCIEFPKVYDSEYVGWIARRCKSFKKRISEEAAQYIAARSGQSLRELAGEVEKLLIYAADRAEITLTDAEEVSGTGRAYSAFDLQKAVGERSLERSIAILYSMLSIDRAEMLILTILSRYFTTLFRLIEPVGQGKDKFTLAKESGAPPYFVGEYVDALKRYSPREIEAALPKIAEADYSLKRSGADNLSIMQNLIIDLVAKTSPAKGI